MFAVNMIQSPLDEMDPGSEGCFCLALTLAFCLSCLVLCPPWNQCDGLVFPESLRPLVEWGPVISIINEN